MSDFSIEEELLKKNFRAICGVDEVGRGSLFGPLVAGAVILDPTRLNPEYDDSKKLSAGHRLRLAHDIYEKAVAYSIGWCWNEEIDRHNILEATKTAMCRAVERLQVTPDFVLTDAVGPDFLPIKGLAIVKGDEKSLSIAAASILAKVFRDHLLEQFAPYFPDYGLAQHKGYPTKKHKNMISLKGKTFLHRKSFQIKDGYR